MFEMSIWFNQGVVLAAKLPDILLDLMSKGHPVLRSPLRLDLKPVGKETQTLQNQPSNFKCSMEITVHIFPFEALAVLLYILTHCKRMQQQRSQEWIN